MKRFAALLMVLCCSLVFLSSAFAADRVVIYTAAEDERIAYLQEELNKQFPDVEIVIQSLGTSRSSLAIRWTSLTSVPAW